jgi:hypothetical protein
MAISTNGAIITRVTSALYGEYLSNASYTEVKDTAPATVAANFLSNDFAGKTDLQVAKTILTNLGLTSITGLDNWLSAQMTAAGSTAAAKGAKLVSILNDYANLTSDATYGSYATSFNAKVAAGLVKSQTTGAAGGAYATADAVAVTNGAFTLTTGADTGASFTGGSGDDVFYATLSGTTNSQTLGNSDRLNGGSGSDELRATLVSNSTPASISGIETITVTADSAATLNLANASGLNTVTSTDSDAALTVSNIATSVTVNITNTGASHTVEYTGVATGTADSATIGLFAVAQDAATAAVDAVAQEVEITISATTADNAVAQVNTYEFPAPDAATDTLVVNYGTSSSTITLGADAEAAGAAFAAAINNAAGQVIAVNASGTVTVTAPVAGVALPSITFGSATNVDDLPTVDFTDANVAATTMNVTYGSVTGSFVVTDDTADTADNLAAAINSLAGAAVATAADDVVTVTAPTAGVTLPSISFTVGANASNAMAPTQDTTVESSAATDAIDGGSLSVAGVETLTLNSTGEDGSTIDTLTATSATKLIVTGDGDLTVNNNLGSTIKTVDASAATGAINVDFTAGDVTAIGGEGADNFSFEGVGAVSASGGLGNDTFILAAGLTVLDTIDGGEGTGDVLSLSAAAAVADAVNVSNVETLTFTAGVSQDLAAFNGITRINATGSAGTYSLTNAPAGLATLGTTVSTTAATVTRKTDTSADSLTLSLSKTAGLTATAITANNEEKITISSTAGTGYTNTITDLTAFDLTTLNVTGSGNLTITNAITSAADLAVVDASVATKAVSINASNSTANMTVTAGAGGLTFTAGTGNDTVNGAAYADNLSGGNGNDSISGGLGNDTIDGGAGNDKLFGDAGDDNITAGSGNDSIDGGAGDDTIVFATNLATFDTIDGGTGNDTITATISSTLAPTLANVETAAITFAAGGAFNAANSSNLTLVTAAGAVDHVITNLNSGVTVRELAAANTLTVDTVAAATTTVNLRAAVAGALSINDAATVTITGSTATASAGSTAVDDTDTTSLTVSAAGTTSLSIGDVSNTSNLTSLTVRTSGNSGSGSVTVGTLADSEDLATITVNATGADGSDVAIGNIGSGTEGEAALVISVTASGGADVDFADITHDDDTLAGANRTSITSITATAGSGSTVDFDAIDIGTAGSSTNSIGSITLSGAGAFTLDGTITAKSIGTFDATAVTGTVSVTLAGIDDNSTLSFGSGAATVTTSLGNTDTINLGRANVTVDTINLNTTTTGAVVVSNFEVGTTGDVIEFSYAGIENSSSLIDVAATAAKGGAVTIDLVSAANAATSITTATLSLMTAVTAATDLGTLTGNVLVVSGDFATTGLLETALEVGGSRALTANGAFAVGDTFLVIYDDGASSYIAGVTVLDITNDDATFAAGDLCVTNIVELVGVAAGTSLVAANMGGALN